jgi:eukaryotic-like serine/threonine-protein kinase
VPDPTESRISRLLGDRYELIELLGKGGFASVYRVRNLRLQRTEAFKVLSETLTEDPDFAKRFEQEARVAAALDHPNIVKIYDYGAIEDFFWFSMQFIAGPSVARELKSRGHFEDASAARIAIGVLDALAYSHGRGVIHRDIKPDNILLDRENRPYLTDFGVAKSQIALVKTQAGTLLGSPAYMSPEQLKGKPLDGRSDLYSLGVTLYKMVSGALPFTGDDTFRATMKRLTEAPQPVLTRRPEIHPMLAEIVMRALERDPEQRFADAVSMRDELEDFVTDVTPPRTRISVLTRLAEDVTPRQTLTPALPASGAADASGAGVEPAGGAAPLPPSPVPPPVAAALPPPAARLRRLGWIALAAAVAALVAAVALVRRPRAATDAPKVPTPPAAARERPSPLAAAPVLSPATTAAPTAEPQETNAPRPTRPAAVATRPPRRAAVLPTRAPSPAPTFAPTEAPIAVPQPGKRTPPEILEQSPLLLSPDVAAAHHSQSIGMLAIVGADGKLKSARIISSVCPECDRAALEAVRRFRFRAAADAKGNPIEGSFGLTIRIP